jgi:hypothetical protein
VALLLPLLPRQQRARLQQQQQQLSTPMHRPVCLQQQVLLLLRYPSCRA